MHAVVLDWTETAFPLQSVLFGGLLAGALKMAVTECLMRIVMQVAFLPVHKIQYVGRITNKILMTKFVCHWKSWEKNTLVK